MSNQLPKERRAELRTTAERAREACVKPTTRRNWSESMWEFQQQFDTSTCLSLLDRIEQLERELVGLRAENERLKADLTETQAAMMRVLRQEDAED